MIKKTAQKMFLVALTNIYIELDQKESDYDNRFELSGIGIKSIFEILIDTEP